MHPIEHLRYLARARGADATSLVRESAVALASLRVDHANLVIAGRRIVERHPAAGPLWWMAARMLTSNDPSSLAWEIADEVDHDPTPRALATALPDEPTVVTIGWPEVAGDGLLLRGDATVWCADSGHEASGFLQRLERLDIDCDAVPSEYLARAVTGADLVVIEAVAASPLRVLASIGSHVLAAVAHSVGTPVWLVTGIGRRLPVEYVDAIADRVLPGAASWDHEIDDLPVSLVTHVVTADGVREDVDRALAPTCPFAPELLRTSPF